MDAERFVKELLDGELGDHIRQDLVRAMIAELATDRYDDSREWADGVAEWLDDQWI